MEAPRKLAELEALRGIAALVVLVHHFMLGFTPRLHGLTYPEQAFSLAGTPAFALVNGSAAVVVFFVLSGYVLSLRVLRTGSARLAAASAAKRWPRLAGPVLLTNALAGFVMAADGFSNRAVAPDVPSLWLGWFYAWPSVGWAEIPASLWEGATTFVTGQALYNSSLWTMFYEFAGSFVVLATALVASRNPRFGGLWLIAIGFLVFGISPYLAPFVVGVALALHDSRPRADWRIARVLPAIAAILLLGGYHESVVNGRPEGLYAALAPAAAFDALRLRVLIHTGAAVLALLLVRRCAALRSAAGGRTGRALGFLSFGLYLCQILVICSISSSTFQAMAGEGRLAQIAASGIVTLVGTLALAVPVAFFDRWWVTRLGLMTSSRRKREEMKRFAPALPGEAPV